VDGDGSGRAWRRGKIVHPLGIFGRIIIRDSHQNDEAALDGAYRLAIHAHAAPQYPLNDRSHLLFSLVDLIFFSFSFNFLLPPPCNK
jgi:hypothetical protein